MSSVSLSSLSDALAGAVDRAATFTVQVQGRRRPASGLVYAPEVVVTMSRALGREDAARVRDGDGAIHPAEVIGWDPATHLAALRVPRLRMPPAPRSSETVRPGHLALAVARSWSNAVTASLGIVSIVGGPMPTGRGLSIPEVIRTSAPMHDGFAGGAFVDSAGALVGICTAVEIRGLAVVIPAATAWPAVDDLLTHGQRTLGYLGVAGQSVRLAAPQRGAEPGEGGVLVAGVSAGSPAEAGGVLVGDVLIEFDGRRVQTPEDLLQALAAGCVDKTVSIRVVRGTTVQTLTTTIQSRAR